MPEIVVVRGLGQARVCWETAGTQDKLPWVYIYTFIERRRIKKRWEEMRSGCRQTGKITGHEMLAYAN